MLLLDRGDILGVENEVDKLAASHQRRSSSSDRSKGHSEDVPDVFES